MDRRSLLVFGVSALACRKSPERPKGPRTRTVEGVEMIELFPHDADESSTLLVAIHGMGDRPERWIDAYRAFPARAHVVLPRAFDRYGDGFSWFTFRDAMTDAELGSEVDAAETRLWKAIAAVRGASGAPRLRGGVRKTLVTGFSQGGILSFAIASRRPTEIAAAFPVSGSCPGPLLPQGKAAPVRAFHGTEDRLLDVKWGRDAVRAFVEKGNDATLREYPGVGHTITDEMRRDLWDAIVKAL
jgi:phospholipase/carboxylesterase